MNAPKNQLPAHSVLVTFLKFAIRKRMFTWSFQVFENKLPATTILAPRQFCFQPRHLHSTLP
jgi:hypothetical protein